MRSNSTIPENADYVIRMGTRPSGLPHLGTLHVINSCYLAAQKAAEQGHRPTIALTFADLLPLRNGVHYGTPLKYHDALSKEPSPANMHMSVIRSYFYHIGECMREWHGLEATTVVATDSGIQSSISYRRSLDMLLQHIDSAPQDVKEGWMHTRIGMVCQPCKKIRPAWYDDGKLYYNCPDHTHLGVELRNDRQGEIALDFLLSSVMRTIVYQPRIHVIGIQHFHDGNIAIFRKILRFRGVNTPRYHLCAHINGVSKSSKKGIRLPALYQEFGDETPMLLLKMSSLIWQLCKKDLDEEVALAMLRASVPTRRTFTTKLSTYSKPIV